MSAQDSLPVTYALLWPNTAVAAAEALRGARDRAAVEGLAELVYRPRSAKEALAAIAALEGCDDPVVLDALAVAVEGAHSSVRLAAVQALHRRGVASIGSACLQQALTRDESWLVRRAALEALANAQGPGRWDLLVAETDPHWRVRHALIRILLGWGELDELRREIEERLERLDRDPRVRGVREYLRYRWSGLRPPGGTAPKPSD